MTRWESYTSNGLLKIDDHVHIQQSQVKVTGVSLMRATYYSLKNIYEGDPQSSVRGQYRVCSSGFDSHLPIEECSSSRPPRSICVSTGLSTQCSTLNFLAPVSLREAPYTKREARKRALFWFEQLLSERDRGWEIESGQLQDPRFAPVANHLLQ